MEPQEMPTATNPSFSFFEKLHIFKNKYISKKTVGVVIALLIAVNIPVALYLSQQRQNVKQHASTNGSITIIDATTDLPITETTTPDVKLQILLPDNWEPQPQSNRLQFIPQVHAQTTTPSETITPSPTPEPTISPSETPPPLPTATETPSPQPSATPTVTPTPTPVTLCQDGSDDQVYSSSMAGCNGAAAFDQAGSLCNTSISHLCSIDEYLANGGRTTAPNTPPNTSTQVFGRWLGTKSGIDTKSCGGKWNLLSRGEQTDTGAFFAYDSSGAIAVDTCENKGYFGSAGQGLPLGATCCSGPIPTVSVPPKKYLLASIIIYNDEMVDGGGDRARTITGQELISTLTNPIAWRLNSLAANEASATRKVRVRFVDTNSKSIDTVAEITLKNPNIQTSPTATPQTTPTPAPGRLCQDGSDDQVYSASMAGCDSNQITTACKTGVSHVCNLNEYLANGGATIPQASGSWRTIDNIVSYRGGCGNGNSFYNDNASSLTERLVSSSTKIGSFISCGQNQGYYDHIPYTQANIGAVCCSGPALPSPTTTIPSITPITGTPSVSGTPSPTITGPTTTPTGTIIPTSTLMPTPTIPAGNTAFIIKLGLQGIDKDNKPKGHPQRTFTITLFDNTGAAVGTGKTGILTFNDATNIFEGQIDMGTPAPGSYTVKAKTDKYLTKIISNILTISQTTKSYSFPTIPTLIAGDLNNDNLLNVQDYNIYKNCLGKNTAECVASSDLNDDGKTDTLVPTPIFLDYKMLIINFSIQKGD